MTLPYIFLFLTSILSISISNRIIIASIAVISIFLGMIWGNITFIGGVSISFFVGVCYLYRKYIDNKLVSFILFVLICALFAAFGFHLIPGFDNLKFANNILISENSCRVSLYLNFDKVLAAISIFLVLNFTETQKNIDQDFVYYTLYAIGIIFLTILPLSFFFNYVEFDPKIPEISLLWLLNNLLFISFSEEIFFRGFIQNQLKRFIPFGGEYIGLIITSIIFGIAHFAGGIIYVFLSIFAGLVYGYSYHKTGNILSSIIVHFSLNTMHFFFFTYPALSDKC